MYIRGCGESSSCSSQLPRVMYMLGEKKEDVEKELKTLLEDDEDGVEDEDNDEDKEDEDKDEDGDEDQGVDKDYFQALQFGALYYERTSQFALALECCEKALDIMDHPFHSSVVLHCKQRLISKL